MVEEVRLRGGGGVQSMGNEPYFLRLPQVTILTMCLIKSWFGLKIGFPQLLASWFIAHPAAAVAPICSQPSLNRHLYKMDTPVRRKPR